MAQITAEKIIAGCKKAQPWNAFKLADYSQYDRVPFVDFKQAIIGDSNEAEIDELLNMVKIMQMGPNANYEKIYTYFILSLSSLLYRG